MDNLLIKYNNALDKFNSYTGLKCYQKVKEVLVEFDVKYNEEMTRIPENGEDSSLNLNPVNPEPRRQYMLDTGLKVNKLA